MGMIGETTGTKLSENGAKAAGHGQIVIRAMRAEDWPNVRRILTESIEAGGATFRTTCPDWAEWDAGHAAQCRFIAEIEDRTAGWAALSPVSGRPEYRGVMELSVYIAQAMRGRGIGKALMNALIDASERAGIWTLQAAIFAENAASIGLHTSCGFRMVGVRERIAQDSAGVWHDTVLLERRSAQL